MPGGRAGGRCSTETQPAPIRTLCPHASSSIGRAPRGHGTPGPGCVAYYLLTGQRVFEADSTMKLLMQHVQASPVAPSRRAASHVPREIDDLVLACLHKDPDRRPQDAGELQQMIRACVTIEPWTQDAARAWWDCHLPSLTTLTTDLDRLPTSGSHPRPAPHTLH